jgi:sugar phosphate isomerase/epimerase
VSPEFIGLAALQNTKKDRANMLKIACQEKFVRAPTLAERIVHLQTLGVDAIELRGKGIMVDGGQEARSALRNSDMPVSAICMGYRGAMLSDDPEERSRTRSDLCFLLDLAEEMEAAGVVLVLAYDRYLLPSMIPATVSKEAQEERLVNELHYLADFLRGMNTAVLLEVRNRYETHIIHRLEEGVAILQQLNSPNIKLLADTFHLNIEEPNLIASIQKYTSYIGYVHLADNHRLLPGMGSLDFAQLFTALLQNKYNGYVSLELWDAMEIDPEPYLSQSLSFLRHCLSEVTPHTYDPPPKWWT